MEFSRPELIEIVERASTIDERVGGNFRPDPTPESEQLAAIRLEKWQQVVAPGDPKRFEKRLAADGLDASAVRPILAGVRLADDRPLPAWTHTLQAALKAAESFNSQSSISHRFIVPDEPLPFEELLAPFVAVARKQVMEKAGADYHLLTEAAQTSLERDLLGKLAAIGTKTLGLEFSIFRLSKQPGSAGWLALPQVNPGRELYRAFVREMLSGELANFFQKYSVLARLVSTATDLWVENNTEFLQRLVSDRVQIRAMFQPGISDLGSVTKLQPGLSDPHHGGRSAMAVTFASGLQIMYKPRGLDSEESYFRLLAWLNERGAPLPFKCLKVMNRRAHGWVEYLAPALCQSKAELARFYQQSGMLLALLYALDATDCHLENIIAAGDQPVLVDAETLMNPRVRLVDQAGDETAQVLAQQKILDSVLRIGLLPQWRFGPNGQVAYDTSGLGAVGEQEIDEQVAWHNLNTDGMGTSYAASRIEPLANTPFQEETNLSPAAYVEEVVTGFEQMYRFLLQQRGTLLAPNGPLAGLARQSTRFLFRDTRGYLSVLHKSLNPKFLRDGADWSIQLDILSRWALSLNGEHPAYWTLLKEEQSALARLDVPYFATRADSDALLLTPRQTIEGFFVQPGYSGVVARLGRLGKDDLAQQLEFIRASYSARFTTGLHPSTASPLLSKMEATGEVTPPLIPAALIQQATRIARELRQRAIYSRDGSNATWIGLSYLPEFERFQLQPLLHDLYSGSGGIALFLAALEKATGGAGFRDLAMAAVQTLRLALQHWPTRSIPQSRQLLGLGGAVGLGATIYGLVRVGEWLNEGALLAEARQAAELITPEVIATDKKLDVMSGAAGAILGLLALYQATDDPSVLEQAIACGQHLLDKRVMSPSGHRTWATLHGKQLAGFSHGAAGIAYALLRLCEAMQHNTEGKRDSSFLAAAQEALAYERSLFSPEARNWPDLRQSTPDGTTPPFAAGWCHGATGIGLARLGGLAVLDTPDIRQDIDTALHTTQQISLEGEDHLCCGNFGRLELLLVAAQRLAHPELSEIARQRAGWVVARARQAGAFQLFTGSAGDIYSPGFFRGTAGIGYQLLRLADPDTLPSVLLWE